MSERPDANEPANPERAAQPDRRALIAGVAALVAGALAKAPERSAEAATGEPLVLGQVNEATDPTQVLYVPLVPDPPVGFQVVAPAGGGGIGAAAVQGPGVFAASGPQSMALTVTPTTSAAFLGVADTDRPTVVVVDWNLAGQVAHLGLAPARIVSAGLDTGLVALGGPAASGLNVTVTATPGEGLFALGDMSGARIGALDAAGAGLTAFSAVPGGLAFQALGRIRLSSSGNGTIQPGEAVVTFPDAHVNASSLVIVIAVTDPGRGVAVSHVEPGAGQFVIHLTRGSRVPFSIKWVALDC